MSNPNLDSRYVSVVTGLSASSDNTLVINAALSAAKGGSFSAGGRVRLPRGVWPIAGRIALTNGQRLEGESSGGSGSYGGTELQCTTASAGVDVTGDGGGLSFIEIGGNNIAQQPMYDHTGADRLHIGVDVHDSAAGYDNWLVEYLQNANFVSCTANRPGRDGLVLDKECGGILFDRFNVSNPTRYAVNIQQSVAPTTAYTTPSHIRFDHPLWERPVGNYPLFNVGNSSAFNVQINSAIMSGANVQTSASLAQIGSSNGFINFDSCQWSGTSVANQAAITAGAGSNISINNTHWMVNVPYFLDNSAGGTVQPNGYVFLNGGTFVTASTASNGDNNVIKTVISATGYARPTGTTIEKGRINGESGERYRRYIDGGMAWGDGTGYSFPTTLSRRTDGKLGITGGLYVDATLAHTGTLFGVRNSSPITAPAISASTAGNPAIKALLTALANQGLITTTATDAGAVPINAQTASYIAVLSDAFGAIQVTSSSATTITIPPNSSVAFAIGTIIEVDQMGTGQVAVAAGTGVTINTSASLTTRTQYSVLQLRKIDTDVWLLSGDMT